MYYNFKELGRNYLRNRLLLFSYIWFQFAKLVLISSVYKKIFVKISFIIWIQLSFYWHINMFIFFYFLGGGGSDNEQLMKQAGLAALAVAVMYYLSVQGRYRLFWMREARNFVDQTKIQWYLILCFPWFFTSSFQKRSRQNQKIYDKSITDEAGYRTCSFRAKDLIFIPNSVFGLYHFLTPRLET